ncbi:DUF3427 domain-containing protein [Corynebacterium doosanense]|uniref:Helicase n=1 Tax=Corynebacterium doosanense CAU 212 = DSM 45436 TaxID=558173 RepID=A0A097IIG7_9CORY|nr:DEAD/DEAH box helicase [Corynebacterium doosanense]AIT61925.1 helicase [Corynebacterium doosanense CAU 212 = DSM 45436]
MNEFPSIAPNVEYGFLDAHVNSDRLHHPLLVSNTDDSTMYKAICDELARSQSFTFSVAFITNSGLALLKQALVDFRGRGTIITSTYQDFNEPNAFRELLNLDNVDAYVVSADDSEGFHAKGYLFRQDFGLTAIVGSSNLTSQALKVNQEWNLRFSALAGGHIVGQLDAAVAKQRDRAIPLTHAWIDDYEIRRRPRILPPLTRTSAQLVPNRMQKAALEALRELVDEGKKRALIVSATGTGKTILAAFAARSAAPERLLFIAHREQILTKAKQSFQDVFDAPSEDFGLYVGGTKQLDRRYVFASYQSLIHGDTLNGIDPRDFDYIIIDEVHRAGAESYRRIINHFRPAFLLGLTATPERTDGANVFELFDYNVAYEIRLQEAMSAKMLSPFHYYGIADFEDAWGRTVGDETSISDLLSDERVDYVVEMLRVYGFPRDVRGLIFCSRNEEAALLSEKLNERSVNDRELRTVALSGKDSEAVREASVQRLEAGELDYIITVDIFNEGIDIPAVNQVVLLRGTQSSIIFTQQLGRGLRKAEGKDHLRVIDFIGNYARNYLIAIALTGDRTGNKNGIREKTQRKAAGIGMGDSSISFDPVSQQRVFAALSKAQLTGKRQFKEAIADLSHRLGQVPRLYDFASFDSMDPFTMASKSGDYWSLLADLKFVERRPSLPEAQHLRYLSTEVLNGLRPHEALILQELLVRRVMSAEEIRSLLVARETTAGDDVVASAGRVLTSEFFNSRRRAELGNIAFVSISDEGWSLDHRFAELYFAYSAEGDRGYTAQSFRHHVDDLLRTSLYLTESQHSWTGDLVVGQQYGRKDVCRLLLWEKNEESTIYGYKVDRVTSTCPLFVTYDKHPDVSASTMYHDELRSPSLMEWYSKSGRTLRSKELAPILGNQVDLHVFVKKSDAEGKIFFYLGEAESTNAKQSTIAGKDDASLNVVTMELEFDSPIEQGLYDYLVHDGVVEAAT